jgi:hypothetical protein
MKEAPILLHINLGNQSLTNWLKENKYIIYSELLRYCEKLLTENLLSVQAIMVSNLYDNIVFLLKKENLNLTLQKAMDYFLEIEEYEQCARIRNLFILIENLKNEGRDIKIGEQNKR